MSVLLTVLKYLRKKIRTSKALKKIFQFLLLVLLKTKQKPNRNQNLFIDPYVNICAYILMLIIKLN